MFGRLDNEIAILERHLRVLDAVAAHEPVGLITLTNRLPDPRHKVRYSLRVLEAEDLVASTAAGATTTDRVPDFRATAAGRLEALQRTLDGCWTGVESAPSAASAVHGD